MPMKENLAIRSKIWIEDADGKVVIGFGRLRMLKAIKRHGSLHAAAKELKIGYRALWARISATEERLGAPLLIKRQGGAAGGGSALTPLGEKLLEDFEKIHKEVEKTADRLFEEAFGKGDREPCDLK